MELLCLTQLLHLYRPEPYCDDLVVYHLFDIRYKLSPVRLREVLNDFIFRGFNPFSAKLSFQSKIMMKSIVSRCDSIINKNNYEKKN